MTDPAATSPRVPHARQALIWTLKVVVSVGLLWLLLSRADVARLWAVARTASAGWLGTALALYLTMVLVSAWRWGLLLGAQQISVRFSTLITSYLVATFFNNFLPSNIGGDVIRIRDTASSAGSKTTATTVVLLDRGLGLLGLVFVAALGASLTARDSATVGPIGPGVLWFGLVVGIAVTATTVLVPEVLGRLLRPLQAIHQAWVTERIARMTHALARFRAAPWALVVGFLGAILVQVVLVGFYAAVACALAIPISLSHLAVLVPLSFIVQMLPVSVNGLGVREATFSFYFAGLHLPLESALALSFISAGLVMLFSASGAFVYLSRRERS